nr:ribonuclease H-like domain-containing protein [Tanacetum cinerariifolium]
MQTQTSNTLHNAIMEAGSKDRPPMLAPGNYVQWRSRIKRYIDTKPNHKLFYYCLENPPYKLDWKDIKVPVSEGSPIATTARIHETYKNVTQEIRDQLNAKVEAVQIILTGIDNDIYSTVDACPNACEMWKAIEMLKHDESINVQDLEINLYREFEKFTSQDGESLESYYSRSAGYENQRNGNVAGARETVGSSMVQKSRIQCYNCKEFRHVVRECQKPKGAKDAAYHREKMLLCEIEDFKNKNKSLESSNNFFKEANNKLFETNNLLYTDYKKSEAELARRNSKEYASQMELECAKVRGDLLSYKIDYHKSCTKYTDTINDLNQTISKMKDKLFAHQETISILLQQKEAQIKLYKTREDKELDKVIELENKVKVLDNIVYKTGQSVQTRNMLNNKCRTSFAKLVFLKKAQRVNPRLYDIVPQREKSSEQRYLSERSRLSHINVNNGKSKESFNKQTTLLEKRMDESIPLDKQCQSSLEIFKIKTYVNTIITGVELCKQKIAKRSYIGYIDPFIQSMIESNFSPVISRINAGLEQFHRCLNEDLKAQLQDKGIVISELKKLIEKLKGKSIDTKFEKSSVIRQPNAFKRVIPTTSVSRPQLKSNPKGDRVMRNNSQGKKQEVEDQRRNVKLPKNKTSVTACNDSLNAKTLNVNSVYATCDKCVLHDKHDMCVLTSVAKPIKKTVASESN